MSDVAPRRVMKSVQPIPEAPVSREQLTSKTVIPHDAANESLVVGVASLSPENLAHLAKTLLPDHFAASENREAWACLLEVNRKKLVPCESIYETESNADVAAHITALGQIAATSGAWKNIDHHVQILLWDYARLKVATNSLSAFVTAIRDPKTEPEKLRSLASAIGGAFDGYQDRKWVSNPEELVRTQMHDISERIAGRATWEYGVPGLDWYDRKHNQIQQDRRCLPGAAPGQITVVTGSSGAGKTTFTASMVLGLMKQNRRILYGAWEMSAGMSLEVIACISLGWSRSQLMEGRGPIATQEGREHFKQRMAEIALKVKFMNNPFRRRVGEKPSNHRNLDLLQAYIEDYSADVFVGDLWQRALVQTEPDAEAEALVRQQAMAEATKCHCILIQQQRLKDIEQRTDKRPTRDGIKGSAAWVEVADTILGVHRPALYKKVEDDKLEVIILKQRFGKWPVSVEFDWNPVSGAVANGRDLDYHAIRDSEVDEAMPKRYKRKA